MKKRYPFLHETWLRFGLAAAFATAFSLNLNAQTAPAKLWDKTIGGSGQELAYSIQQTSDGGYIIGGQSNSNISGDKTQVSKGSYDYWIVKIDGVGNKRWDKTIGASGGDYFWDMQQTSDGGYILGGQSYSGLSGDKSEPNFGTGGAGADYWVVKLDVNGNKLWDKTFGGIGHDGLTCVKQTSDGGYILGGHSNSPVSGNKTLNTNGAWIIKLNSSGNKLWEKVYGGSGTESVTSIQQTSDGGFILGCPTDSGINRDKSQPSQGGYDFWVIKTDNTGNKLWDKTYGGNADDRIFSLHQTADGGYILGGYSTSGVSGNKTQASKGGKDFWVVKTNNLGNIIWDKTLGGSNDEFMRKIIEKPDGSFIMAGTSKSGIGGDKSEQSQGGTDYWVVKLNSIGNKVWDKTFGGNSDDDLFSMGQTLDGGYIIGGGSYSGISTDKTEAVKGFNDYWVVKLGSEVLGIKESEASFNLYISPNPNQGKFNLLLSNLTAPKVEVIISDLLGRVVLQTELQTTNNQLSEELTLPNTKGIYLLQLKAGEQMLTRKIVVE